MDSSRPLSRTPPDGSRSDGTLNPLATALLRDVVEVLGGLSSRAALARSLSESGRPASAELRRIQDDADEFRTMISEILEELEARPSGGNVLFALAPAVESAVDRWLPTGPRVLTTFRSSLPAGASVRGPQSLLNRAMRGLLRESSKLARSRLRLELQPARDEGSPGARAMAEIRVVRDGGHADTAPPDNPSLLVARWGITRLGGRLVGPEPDLDEAESVAFRVLLPLADPPAERIQRGRSWSPTPRQVRPLEGLRIAVVDDEPALRSVLARLLNRAGAEVFTLAPELGDPADALARRILAEPLDLVLLDLHLGRISGKKVLDVLEARGGPRVILLTGDPEQARDLSCPVVAKPVDWPELVRQIQRSLADG